MTAAAREGPSACACCSFRGESDSGSAREAVGYSAAARHGGCCGKSRCTCFRGSVLVGRRRCQRELGLATARSGRRRGGGVPPELEEVVGRRGEAPLGPCRGPAAA